MYLLDLEHPKARPSQVSWPPMPGGMSALAIAETVLAWHAPVLLVVDDPRDVTPLRDDCEFFLAHQRDVAEFPGWEMLPYDNFSAHTDLISNRLALLARLPHQTNGLIVASVPTLMQRVPPRDYLDRFGLVLKEGDRIDLEMLRNRLVKAGYTLVSQVMEHGEAAIRGGVVDLFPMGTDDPYRLELFDDRLESIRRFDPENQRSKERLTSIRALPAREFPTDRDALGLFFERYQQAFKTNAAKVPVYRQLSHGQVPAGTEFYLPLFFDALATVFDYLPDDALVIGHGDTQGAAERFWTDCKTRYEQRQGNLERPPLPPEALYLQPPAFMGIIKEFAQVRTARDRSRDDDSLIHDGEPLDLRVDSRGSDPHVRLKAFAASFQGRVLLVAESEGRRELMLDTLRRSAMQAVIVGDWREFLGSTDSLAITIAPLDTGLVLPEQALAVIVEAQLFGPHVHLHRHRAATRALDRLGAVVRDLSELRERDAVVHADHGVGRYLGLETLTADGIAAEFLVLEYEGGDKVYVPVAHLHLIHRYVGGEETAPLHKLGTPQWQRAKRRALQKVHDVAAELLEIYALRAARKGHSHRVSDIDYRAFVATFPFEETPDQAQAIAKVCEDLRGEQPMDRVICGDVGFGKTEVAMRAAFIVAAGGRQVAILAPTTLLVQQHTQNFRDRFADWPIRVESLSRFSNRGEQIAVLDAVAKGAVDIVIGTHRLLQADVRYHNLGLVVVDEEHRFGVRQKERFKSLRGELDVLTLTATPIPRTLSMALAGIRDLSIIATPPAKRLSVKTFVRTWDPPSIREACLREFSRGGQVYVLHNRVETIDKLGREMAAIVPEADMRIAHGQLPERELEQIMLDFYHRRFNLLVCTTIIESGIDVPTANTIVIDRADRLGLAQLHQLRGRVGRSHHQAYAYLTVPYKEALKGDALKRLEAVETLGELGLGFTLATHDMEIRGAGELLGSSQSGHIQEVGFTLYNELLEGAVADLKTGRDPSEQPATHDKLDIDLRLAALLPDTYVPDVRTRLVMYKRLAGARDLVDVADLRVECVDRFGSLPPPTANLFGVAELRIRGKALGVSRIAGGVEGVTLTFDQQPAIDLDALLTLVRTQPDVYRFDGKNRLRLVMDLANPAARIETTLALLSRLTPEPRRATA